MPSRAIKPYEVTAHPGDPTADSPRHRRKPLVKRVWFWLVLVAVALVIAVRIALNPLAAHFTQRGLDSITGYHGSFGSVAVSVVPPRYRVTDLKLIQDGDEHQEPAVYVKTLDAGLVGRKLFKGQLVASASLQDAKFVVKVGQTKVPPEAKEAADKAKREVQKDNLDLSKTLSKVVPLRADRIELRQGEVVMIDATDPKLPRLWVNDIELVLDNLATRRRLDENVPLSLTLRGVVQRTGVLKVMAAADVLADDKPAFTGQAQLSGLKLESLYEWAAAKAGVSPHGTLDAFVNFNSAKGALSGNVKVMVREAKLEPATDKVGDELKAKIGTMALKVLSDRVEGREAVGATLPIRGQLQSPDAQVWPTVLSVVRNAFVDAIDWGFRDLPTPTAPERQGLLKQAAEGLDKKEPGPKAQPTK